MSSSGRISGEELRVLILDLKAIASQIGEGRRWASLDDSVWRTYVKAEMMVTMLKFRLSVERPGQFIKTIRRRPLTKHIIAALDSAIHAEERAQAGDELNALESLRECRNDLRFFLEAVRNLRIRAARERTRRKRVSSTPSSSSTS